MNTSIREKRLAYKAILNEANCMLCSFCKFASFGGGSVCYGESYMECEHKLVDRLETEHGTYGMEPGDDCWAFRPYEKIDVVADIVGLMLGTEDGSSWIKKDDGTYSVYVVKEIGI